MRNPLFDSSSNNFYFLSKSQPNEKLGWLTCESKYILFEETVFMLSSNASISLYRLTVLPKAVASMETTARQITCLKEHISTMAYNWHQRKISWIQNVNLVHIVQKHFDKALTYEGTFSYTLE